MVIPVRTSPVFLILELRRLKFSPGDGGSRQNLMAYQMALCSSVLKSLGDIYPDLPVGSFNDGVAFTAKDEVSKRRGVGSQGGILATGSFNNHFSVAYKTVKCSQF